MAGDIFAVITIVVDKNVGVAAVVITIVDDKGGQLRQPTMSAAASVMIVVSVSTFIADATVAVADVDVIVFRLLTFDGCS